MKLIPITGRRCGAGGGQVSEFEGLCGFRPLDEIAAALATCPELAVREEGEGPRERVRARARG